jgi:Holliday junction DNA helicase RuvA
MIERLCGTVIASSDRTITIMAGPIGFGVVVADPAEFMKPGAVTVFIHEHWNAEKGGALYGFSDEVSRQLFCLLIGCSKIGPSIALALLRQRDVAAIVHDIVSGNVSGLSSCQGIGTKKAELIIHELKDKVASIVHMPGMSDSSSAHLQQVQDALLSLSYSKQEAAKALQYVAAQYKQANAMPEVNVLIRKALAFLSAPRE